MQNWTPEQIVLVLGAIGALLTGVGKLYIDARTKELDVLKVEVAKLQTKYDKLFGRYQSQRESLVAAQAEILMLRAVLHLHKIEVPPVVTPKARAEDETDDEQP